MISIILEKFLKVLFYYIIYFDFCIVYKRNDFEVDKLKYIYCGEYFI